MNITVSEGLRFQILGRVSRSTTKGVATLQSLKDFLPIVRLLYQCPGAMLFPQCNLSYSLAMCTGRRFRKLWLNRGFPVEPEALVSVSARIHHVT